MKIICLRMQMLLLVWKFTLFYTLTLSTGVREFSFDNKGEKQLGQSLGLRGPASFSAERDSPLERRESSVEDILVTDETEELICTSNLIV